MTNVIKFPIKPKLALPTPRQRVFYLGYRYVGPDLCQEVQDVYLKRHGKTAEGRRWSIIIYGKYQEDDKRSYSIEMDNCSENNVPDMLTRNDVGDAVSFEDLEQMGWRGTVAFSAKIISIFDRKHTKPSERSPVDV